MVNDYDVVSAREGTPVTSPPLETVSQLRRTNFCERGGAVGWKRFRAETFKGSKSGVPSPMNAFDFIQATICHDLKDPLSKSLEPDCLSPRIAIRHSLLTGGDEGEGELCQFI